MLRTGLISLLGLLLLAGPAAAAHAPRHVDDLYTLSSARFSANWNYNHFNSWFDMSSNSTQTLRVRGKEAVTATSYKRLTPAAFGVNGGWSAAIKGTGNGSATTESTEHGTKSCGQYQYAVRDLARTINIQTKPLKGKFVLVIWEVGQHPGRAGKVDEVGRKIRNGCGDDGAGLSMRPLSAAFVFLQPNNVAAPGCKQAVWGCSLVPKKRFTKSVVKLSLKLTRPVSEEHSPWGFGWATRDETITYRLDATLRKVALPRSPR
jgi:hypothetical protein